MSHGRNLSLAVAALLIIVGAGCSGQTTPTSSDSNSAQLSTVFLSEPGNFSVDFGGEPVYTPDSGSTDEGTSFPTHLYQYELPYGSLYQAFYTEYPESFDVSVPENTLTASVESARNSLGGQIVSSELVTYQGYPAIEFLIFVPDGNGYYKGLHVFNGHKFYALSYLYDAGNEMPSDSFFGSLVIN